MGRRSRGCSRRPRAPRGGLREVPEALAQGVRRVYEGCYRFHLERLDGTFAAFSWKQAYRDMYHRYFAKSFKFDVEMALRAAILPHLVAYKEAQRELVSDWSGRVLHWEQAAVQHFPTSFQEIVASFLDHLQINLDHVQLDSDPTH